MKNVNALISERLKKGGPTSKMTAMAERSASGHMTTFSGLFSPQGLTDMEKEALTDLLNQYATGNEDIDYDLSQLTLITSEVKAINNQAALLHGERIKRAQGILKSYNEGAFTAWLITTYGNRQTPYNLLQYYEFHENLPKPLKFKLESMPRQAIYTLASREGEHSKKLEIVENYQGEKKQALLALIRELFPLHEKDKRSQNHFQGAISHLDRMKSSLAKLRSITKTQREALKEELSNLKSLIDLIKVR